MKLKFVILPIAALVSGCSLFSSTDKAKPPAPLTEFQAQATVLSQWSGSVPGLDKKPGLKISLTEKDGKLYAASPNGAVLAFSASGAQLWRVDTQHAFTTGVGVGAGLLLIGTRAGLVVAFKAEDGSQLWEVQTGGELLAPPQAAADVSVARTTDGRLLGLDTRTGAQLWTYNRKEPVLTLRGTSSPLRVSDVVLAGFDNGRLAGLEATTGKLLWEIPVAQSSGRSDLERMVDIDADLELLGTTLYATAYQGRTVAVDLRAGKMQWERQTSSFQGFAVDDNALYLSQADSTVVALDRASGAPLWTQDKLENRQITAPALVDNYLAVGDMEGYVHVLDRSNGQFVARYALGRSPIVARPLAANGQLYVINTAGAISALKLEGAR